MGERPASGSLEDWDPATTIPGGKDETVRAEETSGKDSGEVAG